MKGNIKEFCGEKLLKLLGLKKVLKFYYYLKTGKKLNLNNPSRFNEKIQLRKLNYNNPLYFLCADKYKARDYIKDKVGEKYLIPLLFVGDNIKVKDLKELPNSFVIKTNNASKTNLIVFDKEKETLEELVKKVNKFLKIKFWYRSFEMFYSKVSPKVIVEKLLLTKENKVPDDYKIHIFNNNKNSKVIIQVDSDRMNNHKRAFFSENWEELDYSLGFKKNENKINKPDNLEEMLFVAKKLSKEFDYIRVDLYNVNGKIYFGELTFTHGSGYEKFSPDSIDLEWGRYWN